MRSLGPKKQGAGTLARASVQNYYGPAEKALTRALRKYIRESDRVPGPGDLETLYHRALEITSSSNDGSVLRKKFLSLHEIAVRQFFIDDVDTSDYWGVLASVPALSASRSGIKFATDHEIEAISTALFDHCNPDADLSEFVDQDRRTILQATLAFHLAAVSGGRINEMLSRHTIDSYCLGREKPPS